MLGFWFFANVAAIALPLALFELWLEKFKTGFGGEFRSAFWGYKIRWGPICWLSEKACLSVYHLVVFGISLPLILATEWLVWQASGGVPKLVSWLFLPAVWLGVATLEDFLYFALNWLFQWPYPQALSCLLRGEVAWHTKWLTFGQIKLPRFYLTTPLLIAVLLTIQHHLLRSGFY